MASISDPFLSGDASGSVDSLTCSRNISGKFLRSKIKGVKKRSFFRTHQSNSVFIHAKYLWTNFTPAIRSQWQDFAIHLVRSNALGKKYQLKPETLFYEFCSRTLTYFSVPPTSVPLTYSCEYLPTFSTERDADGILLHWDESIPIENGIAVFTWRNLLSSQFRTRNKKLAYFFDQTYTSPQRICSAAGAVSDLDFLPFATGGTYTFFWIKTVDRSGRQSPSIHYQIENSP